MRWREDPATTCPGGSCWTGVSDGLQIQRVGPDGAPAAPVRAEGVGYATVPKLGVDRTGTAEVVFDAMDGTGAVTVPPDSAPCPARRIAGHRSIPAPPSLQAGAIGIVAWQEIPSSNVHVALHRPQLGCDLPAPAGGETGAPSAGAVAGAATPATFPAAPTASSGASASAPPPAVSRPRVPALGRVAIAGDRRTARLRLRCPRGADACAGVLRIAARRTARSARTRLLGATRFEIEPGRASAVRVALSTAARRALGRGPVPAEVRLRVPGARTQVLQRRLVP
jgi:hypothetical protein